MKLSIEKKTGDLVFWAVNTTGLSYNSEINIGDDVTILVTYEGRNYTAMCGKKTLGSIINPDKATKVFGSMSKVDCKIYAFDENNVFNGMWGIGGLKFRDPETKITYTARANGDYDFRLVSLEDFVSFTKAKTEAVLNQDAIKIKIREELHSIVRSVLLRHLNSTGLNNVRADSSLCEEIKNIFNGTDGKNGLKNSGMRLNSFRIDFIDFTDESAQTERDINDARKGVVITKLENEAVRDSAEISLIGKNDEKVAVNTVLICHKCHEINEGSAIYCKKCGEKII